MVEPRIIWLASYPKSGNTWTRLFLHALQNQGVLEDIQTIDSTSGISSSKFLTEEYAGIDIDDIPEYHVQLKRNKVFELWNKDLKEDVIMKSHDTPYFRGNRIIPDSVTKKVILIVRNPFDLVASVANHNGTSIPAALTRICDDSTVLSKQKKGYHFQLAQHTGSWSYFYRRWKNAFREKVIVFKYEEMLKNPFGEFKRIIELLDWDYSDEKIKNVVEVTEFSRIKKIEKEKGFVERPDHTESFFRKGKVGGWRDEITQEMADYLIDCHYDVLLELNYIDEQRNILV